METRNDILEELKSWGSPLAGVSRNMPYRVPAGYFEALSPTITQYITHYHTADPSLAGVGRQMPYRVPQGYFDMLPMQMLGLVQHEAAILPKATPFAVPEGYFNTLPAQMLAAAKAADAAPAEKPRTIALRTNLWQSVRWAAAALLVAGLGFGTYKALYNDSVTVTPKPSIESQLAALSKAEISNYIQQNIDDFDSEVLESSVAKLDAGTSAPANAIDQLSDDEIIRYLDETGWEEEAPEQQIN